MPRLIENRIQFPYKRSLGPVFGAFMTALVGRKILGIRNGDQVLAPPLEWDPAHRRGARTRIRRGRARRARSRTGRGCPSPRAAPARPAVRVRDHPARRRRQLDDPRGRRREHGRDVRGHAGRAAVAGGAHRQDQRHRVLRARRGTRGPRGDAGRSAGRTGDDDGVLRVHHVPEPGAGQRRARRRSRQGEAAARPAVPGVRADLRRRPRVLPDRLGGARPRSTTSTSRSAASSATTRSSRRCSIRARPRPRRSPG